MGFPVNNFTVLSTLAKGMLKKIPFDFIEDHVFEEIHRKIIDFDAFAVVVHDPSRHKEFDEYIKEEFYTLHRLTGKNLLFFSLVQPPEEWLEETGSDGFGLSRNFLTNWNIGPQYRNISSIDDSIDTLTEVFRVRLGAAPLVLLFKSFLDKRVLVFDTGPDKLRIQLELVVQEIHSNPSILIDRIADRMEHHYSNNSYFSLQTYASPIIELLDQMVTEITYKGRYYDTVKVKDYFIKRFSKVRNELKLFLDRPWKDPYEFNPSPEELAELHERNSIYALTKLKFQNITYREDPLVERLKKYFDEDSIVYLHTAVTLKQLLGSVGRQRGVDSLDYACIGIEYGRAFENEINLSLSHFVREQLKVQLPEYFYRFQTGVIAKMIVSGVKGEFTIDFNDRNTFNVVNNRDWTPIELGRILKAIEAILDPDMLYLNAQDQLTQIFGELKLYILKENWAKIKNIRNKCAHTAPVTLNDIYEVEKAFNNILNAGIFEILADLKNKYRAN